MRSTAKPARRRVALPRPPALAIPGARPAQQAAAVVLEAAGGLVAVPGV